MTHTLEPAGVACQKCSRQRDGYLRVRRGLAIAVAVIVMIIVSIIVSAEGWSKLRVLRMSGKFTWQDKARSNVKITTETSMHS